MGRTFDEGGNLLGALPADAVRIDSRSGNVHTLLTGKYVDSDGIVYTSNGSVDEPATALYAREIAAQRIAAPYAAYTPPFIDLMRDSVQEQGEAAGTRSEWDSFFDNVYETSADVANRVAAIPGQAFTIGQWFVVGLVAYAAIQALDKVPSQGHIKRYTKRRVREYRRQLAKHVAGN